MSNSSYETYVSPLSTRYASTEMKYNFSDRKKFYTWRTLWIFLAQAQKVIYPKKNSSFTYNLFKEIINVSRHLLILFMDVWLMIAYLLEKHYRHIPTAALSVLTNFKRTFCKMDLSHGCLMLIIFLKSI